MMPLLTPILATLLLAQAPAGRPASGEVVDDQGKPVADAQVVLYSPPTVYGNGDSIEVRATSDAQGKFNLRVPPLKRIFVNGVHFFAYRPGLAIAAQELSRGPYRLVLEKPRPRTVKVEGPDGQPIAGARLALRLVRVFGGANAEVPASLADPLVTSTGSDGKATITTMAPRDQLVAVRVTADAIGTQDILLIKRPGRDSEESVIVIKLKPTSHLAGRIVDQDGQPVAGQLVEVWSRGDATWLGPNTVEFNHGPVRSAGDGSFQTPDNLMIGLPYRVAVRETGKEAILSDWITIGEKPRTLPLMVLRPLRTVSGRMVDRQGMPVANVEVFQSGDGPQRTTTRTDAEGRFSLDGFRHGPVFLFANGEGFRFQGQLVKATDRTVTVELTRASERPAREMMMLPDAISREESLALARRLVEPLWDSVAQDGTDSAKHSALSSLASVDPARVLGTLETVKFKSEGSRNRLQRELVVALARTDFEEATAVAESIADAGTSSWALIRLADQLPAAERDRKLALLGRALLQARITADQSDRLLRMGDVAERWFELGDVDKARALFAEGLEIARKFTDKADIKRGWFAARLARVDLPAALAVAKDFDGDRSQARVLGSIALRLVDPNPAEAERVWAQTGKMSQGVALAPTLCWKLAGVEPARARRVIEGLAGIKNAPEQYFFLALGSKGRDEAVSHQAFEIGVRELDRFMQDRLEWYQHIAGALLPIVERIDPALVSEVFWRDVASRLAVGNPRTLQAYSPSYLITRLAWYDRDVAAALFEPSLARIHEAHGVQTGDSAYEFVAWSLFDPRAAFARLEKLPIDPKVQNNAIHARLAVAKSLAKTHDQRWREIWKDWDIIFGGNTRDF